MQGEVFFGGGGQGGLWSVKVLCVCVWGVCLEREGGLKGWWGRGKRKGGGGGGRRGGGGGVGRGL